VGSPRRTLVLLAVLLVGAVSAVPAAADPADEARAVAGRFLEALARGDGATVCGLLSPRTLEKLGGEARCEHAFADDSSPDAEAVGTLVRAYTAARKSAAKRHGRWVTKSFGPKALARAMERIDPELTVKLGKSARAASGQLVTTAVLDVRSTARRLVLYAESDDGSILRLSAARGRSPDLAEVGQGVPEASPPASPGPAFNVSVGSVAFVDGKAYVQALLRSTDPDEQDESYPVVVVLVPRADGGYAVDDLLFSLFGALGS
jgi:hypothetical protein